MKVVSILNKRSVYKYLLLAVVCILLIVYVKQNICFACYTEKKSDENKNKDISKIMIFENKMAVIYDDYNGELEIITDMIKDNMLVDIYSIEDYKNVNIADYDLIIIGSSIRDDEPTINLKMYLPEIDFLQKNVSFYYIGAFDSGMFKNNMKDLIHNGNVLSRIVFNSDEISETDIVNSFVDGWLTSISNSHLNEE